jgi:hypothetical protein
MRFQARDMPHCGSLPGEKNWPDRSALLALAIRAICIFLLHPVFAAPFQKQPFKVALSAQQEKQNCADWHSFASFDRRGNGIPGQGPKGNPRQ